MEVTVQLDDDCMLPETTYIAIRVGDVQKQYRYDPKRVYRFADRRRCYGKVEILKRIGVCNVTLDPDLHENRICQVDLSDSIDSVVPEYLRLNVGVQEPAISAQEAEQVKRNKSMEAGANAKKYLAQHGVEEMLTGAMRSLVKEKPQNASAFLVDYITRQDPGAFNQMVGLPRQIPGQSQGRVHARRPANTRLPPINAPPAPPPPIDKLSPNGRQTFHKQFEPRLHNHPPSALLPPSPFASGNDQAEPRRPRSLSPEAKNGPSNRLITLKPMPSEQVIPPPCRFPLPPAPTELPPELPEKTAEQSSRQVPWNQYPSVGSWLQLAPKCQEEKVPPNVAPAAAEEEKVPPSVAPAAAEEEKVPPSVAPAAAEEKAAPPPPAVEEEKVPPSVAPAAAEEKTAPPPPAVEEEKAPPSVAPAAAEGVDEPSGYWYEVCPQVGVWSEIPSVGTWRNNLRKVFVPPFVNVAGDEEDEHWSVVSTPLPKARAPPLSVEVAEDQAEGPKAIAPPADDKAEGPKVIAPPADDKAEGPKAIAPPADDKAEGPQAIAPPADDKVLWNQYPSVGSWLRLAPNCEEPTPDAPVPQQEEMPVQAKEPTPDASVSQQEEIPVQVKEPVSLVQVATKLATDADSASLPTRLKPSVATWLGFLLPKEDDAQEEKESNMDDDDTISRSVSQHLVGRTETTWSLFRSGTCGLDSDDIQEQEETCSKLRTALEACSEQGAVGFTADNRLPEVMETMSKVRSALEAAVQEKSAPPATEAPPREEKSAPPATEPPPQEEKSAPPATEPPPQEEKSAPPATESPPQEEKSAPPATEPAPQEDKSAPSAVEPPREVSSRGTICCYRLSDSLKRAEADGRLATTVENTMAKQEKTAQSRVVPTIQEKTAQSRVVPTIQVTSPANSKRTEATSTKKDKTPKRQAAAPTPKQDFVEEMKVQFRDKMLSLISSNSLAKVLKEGEPSSTSVRSPQLQAKEIGKDEPEATPLPVEESKQAVAQPEELPDKKATPLSIEESKRDVAQPEELPGEKATPLPVEESKQDPAQPEEVPDEKAAPVPVEVSKKDAAQPQELPDEKATPLPVEESKQDPAQHEELPDEKATPLPVEESKQDVAQHEELPDEKATPLPVEESKQDVSHPEELPHEKAPPSNPMEVAVSISTRGSVYVDMDDEDKKLPRRCSTMSLDDDEPEIAIERTETSWSLFRSGTCGPLEAVPEAPETDSAPQVEDNKQDKAQQEALPAEEKAPETDSLPQVEDNKHDKAQPEALPVEQKAPEADSLLQVEHNKQNKAQPEASPAKQEAPETDSSPQVEDNKQDKAQPEALPADQKAPETDASPQVEDNKQDKARPEAVLAEQTAPETDSSPPVEDNNQDKAQPEALPAEQEDSPLPWNLSPSVGSWLGRLGDAHFQDEMQAPLSAESSKQDEALPPAVPEKHEAPVAESQPLPAEDNQREKAHPPVIPAEDKEALSKNAIEEAQTSSPRDMPVQDSVALASNLERTGNSTGELDVTALPEVDADEDEAPLPQGCLERNASIVLTAPFENTVSLEQMLALELEMLSSSVKQAASSSSSPDPGTRQYYCQNVIASLDAKAWARIHNRFSKKRAAAKYRVNIPMAAAQPPTPSRAKSKPWTMTLASNPSMMDSQPSIDKKKSTTWSMSVAVDESDGVIRKAGSTLGSSFGGSFGTSLGSANMSAFGLSAMNFNTSAGMGSTLGAVPEMPPSPLPMVVSGFLRSSTLFKHLDADIIEDNDDQAKE